MGDFFISYTASDREWADWIGVELESLAHTAHIHDWEIRGGENIVAWMNDRIEKADYCLCVISKAYLSAPYSSWERNAA